MNPTLLRHIPKVDEVLKLPEVQTLLRHHPRSVVVEAVRGALDIFRQEILADIRDSIGSEELLRSIHAVITSAQKRHLTRVINGTGIIVHTNLGRSCLSPDAIEAVVEAAGRYSNLEYDLDRGKRGSRYSHIDRLLCEILDCEAAFVVNNNAAAILLVLSTLTQGKEAIVSRGELVEIGGSFRIPDVMRQGGCILREVGTTNRTHLKDYEEAITERTGLLLRVHTSNYRVVGFTKSVSLADLHALSLKAGIPLVEDMGSGLLIDLSPYGLSDEPTVQESLRAGVDVVTFSGDKLLGGPQAGIIAGKKRYIEQMISHPLTRAFRIDKMTLAALEATLLHYRDHEHALRTIVTLHKITLPLEDLQRKALALQQQFSQLGIPSELIQAFSQVGGGALPLEQLPTYCVAVTVDDVTPNRIERGLRQADPPVIGRIFKERFVLDVRTIDETEFPLIAKLLYSTLGRMPQEEKSSSHLTEKQQSGNNQ